MSKQNHYTELLFNIDLQIREKMKQVKRLEEKRENTMREYDLWRKRGKNPLPMDRVREEFAS